MQKMLSVSLLVSLFFFLFPLSVSAEPSVSAQSAVVIEASSGRVLYEKNAESKLPMASTTKIITAMVALQQGKLTDKVKISSIAAETEGSSMYLETGEIMTLEELLYGLMLASGNDAAVAISEHLGGTEKFVAQMNQTAKTLGATNTHFENPNGLPHENHYSTAYDMALLTAKGLENANFSKIVSTKSYSISGEGKSYSRTLTNHNKLLRMMEDCIGVKTGFTKAAGRCLVSAAKRNGMTLICVTLNAPDDWNDHQTLYHHLFSHYQLCPLVRAGIPLATIPVEHSQTTSLPLTAKEDFLYPLAENEYSNTTLSISPPLSAPVADGTEGGSATVYLGNTPVGTVPLITVGNAKRQSLFSTGEGGVLHQFLHFWGKLFGISN